LAVVADGGGAPFSTLATLKTLCPSAVVIGFGVNIGSNNPSYDVETDLVSFNGTAYDFEPAIGRPRARTRARTAGGRRSTPRRSRTRAIASAISPPAARTKGNGWHHLRFPLYREGPAPAGPSLCAARPSLETVGSRTIVESRSDGVRPARV
jgi:hypothetical protein